MASTIWRQMKVVNPVRKIIPKGAIPYSKYVATILGVNILLSILVLLLQDNIPPTVPLFYGRPRGNEQLAPQLFLLLPPGIAILVTALNTIFAVITEDKFIRKVLIGIAFAATLLSTITVIKIVLLVGSI